MCWKAWYLSTLSLLALIVLLPTSCSCFSSNIIPTTKSIFTAWQVISKKSLHASNGNSNDDSWSPFDDGEDRTSSKEWRKKSDDLSLSPSDVGNDRTQLFIPEPDQKRPTDSLLGTLTRIDPGMENVPTNTVPIFGEIPRDGTLLILVPSIAITFLGLVLSVKIGIESRDFIADELAAVTTVLSQPPVKDSTVKSGCRGLCSNQAESLEYMRGFMEGLSSNK